MSSSVRIHSSSVSSPSSSLLRLQLQTDRDVLEDTIARSRPLSREEERNKRDRRLSGMWALGCYVVVIADGDCRSSR